MSNVTIQHIALELGVHKMTVSRALRNLPGVNPETREKIIATAERLGYRPNPMVNALMTQVREGKVANRGAPLAVLYEKGSWDHIMRHPIRCELHQGVIKEAERLNIHIEYHEYSKESRWNRRLEDILYARGIGSVIILAPLTPFLSLDLTFPHLSPISIGNRLKHPIVHRVTTDHTANVETTFDHLLEKGFRRIGYIHDEMVELHSYGIRSNAFRFFQNMHLQENERIPFFFCRNRIPRGIKTWYRTHRPDVVVYSGLYAPSTELASAELPDDKREVFMALTQDALDHSGVVEPSLEIGAMAVRLALHAAAIGLSGTPDTRCSSMIQGTFHWAEEPFKPIKTRRLMDQLDVI